jgi:hypothetical protein
MMVQALWIVVLVEKGIATQAEAYMNEQMAFARSATLREEIDPEDDSINVFELVLPEQFDDGWSIELDQHE